MAIEDTISQQIADVGNAIYKFPRPTQRAELIEQLGEAYKFLKEKFKVNI